jgi:uncharacterized glyoxalase superfamily protein PhnB
MARDPAVVPMLAYEDGPAAMDWLARAFGFRERMRMLTRDGRLSQGEMEAGGGVIMLASPTPDYESPRHHRETCAQAAAWSRVPYIIDGVLVYVDDVDAHFQRAQAAGATIPSGVETGEHGKRYRAEDLEGHRWMFMQSVSPNLVAPARQR